MFPNEIHVCAADLKKIYRKHCSLLLQVGVCVFALTFFFFLLTPTRYTATATFKQAAAKEENSAALPLKSILKSVGFSEAENGAASYMLSQRLMRSVIEELGLQVEVKKGNPFSKIFKRIRNNLCAELSFKISDPEPFVFRDVHYDGERPLFLYLSFHRNGRFDLFSEKKEKIGSGKIGEAYIQKELRFSVQKPPRHLSYKLLYPVAISPWAGVASEMQKKLEVRPSKLDKSVLQLKFSHPDRHMAALFLNRIMSVYQAHLQKENEELAEAQLRYLEKREGELGQKLEGTLCEHATYLQKNLGEKGFIGLDQEVEVLAAPRQDYTSKLFDLDLELERLEKKVDSSSTTVREAQGMSLSGAQSLCLQYNNELDAIETKLRQLRFLREEIPAPQFELSSLATVLDDSVSREMVQKASTIALQLKDEKNHSLKEVVRLHEALCTQKNFLAQHVDQTIELSHLRKKILEEKIASLQHLCLDLLKKEKGLIQEKLNALGVQMEDLPEKWRLENQLEFKKELGMKMIEGINALVESKNLGYHLFHVSSKPIDAALAPLLPNRPGLFLFSLLGAFAGAGGFFLFFLSRSFIKGFPVTLQGLAVQKIPCAGTLSRCCATPLPELGLKDLEVLRALTHFASPYRCISIIGGEGTDYSPCLAELLALQNKRVLLVRLSFEGLVPAHHVPGLWHYLEEEVDYPLIRQKGNFDFLPTGGTTRHATELLRRPRFAEYLSQMKKNYDLVILYTTSSLNGSGAHALFDYSDALIATLKEERIDDLKRYREWAEKKEGEALTFVCTE